MDRLNFRRREHSEYLLYVENGRRDKVITSPSHHSSCPNIKHQTPIIFLEWVQ